MKHQKFLVVIEKAGKNFSAFSPDLPGCISTGKTRAEAERNMLEAMQLHIDGTIADGEKIPKSESSAVTMMLEIPGKKKAAVRAPRLAKTTRHLGRGL
ncbi:type II toxin-antitoxin system HicB family antitoxin [bacterium]|nr:type II toxin-antitoxin system HicB family antitoxin [bacterium]